jgi:Rho-binding antiterminator
MAHLSCHLHDYLEVACIYAYEVKLTLLNGDQPTSKAATTTISSQKEECFRIESASGVLCDVPTLQIQHLHVTTPNAKFTDIEFVTATKN